MNRQKLFGAIAAAVVVPLMGCVASGPGNGNNQQQQIQVTVTSSPSSPAAVYVSTPTNAMPDTVQYTATVTGTSNTAVTWSLSSYSGAATTCTASGNGLGTVATTGNNTMTYTAPSSVPVSPCEVVVTATASDNMTTGQALAKVSVFVTVAPLADTIGQGANLQFSATVAGAPSGSQSVDWTAPSCSPCTSSNQQTGGAFDPLNPGLFVAPNLVEGVSTVVTTINAASTFDNNQVGTTTITVLQNDPLGSVSSSMQITCPTFSGGVPGTATCYQVNVSCDGIAPWSAYLKVNAPTGNPLGTVILGTGSGGSLLYDNDTDFISGSFNGGETVVQDLLNTGVTNAGYTTVQVSFGSPFNSTNTQNGWLQGPGGVRRLACRYATVADWVFKNIHASSTSLPYCATGNSGGSGAIGYALSEYGLAHEFAMAELTSGPVMTSLQMGCNTCGQYQGSNPCSQTQENLCYSASAGGTGATASIIDTAYQAQGQSTPTLCSNGVNGDNSNFTRFRSDSIESDPGISPALPIPNPPTNVNVVFGDSDSTNAVPMGYAWWGAVGPKPPPAVCVPNAPHAIPSIPGGVTQIVTDIQSMCVVH